MFNPVEYLKNMAASGVPQNVLHQTAQVWARLYPEQFNEIYAIMQSYRAPEGIPVTAASQSGTPMVGLSFTADDFGKKKITGNVVPVSHPDTPFFSGVYEEPVPPTELKAFESIEKAYEYYKAKDLKGLIKELKSKGLKIFAGANESQVLELLNHVNKSEENGNTTNKD